jgi:cytochrome c oxidase subunit 2
VRRVLPLALLALAGCEALTSGPQSALDPAGPNARVLARLFWIMVAGGAVIWLITIGATVYAVRVRPRAHSERTGRGVILVGGVLFPVVVLAGLLGYGLAVMADQRGRVSEMGAGIAAGAVPTDPGRLRIHVSGEQWWWRVHYYAPGSLEPVVSANEVRLPVGVPVEFTLTSPDVNHSIWIPALGGKLDMIPGRLNRFVLEADEPGTFRGECAEFCGTSHALMAFAVETMEPAAFDAWLMAEARPAPAPATPTARAAMTTFLETGCDACHAIRGTEADGRIGPDLTHLGRRHTIAAGMLPNNAGTIAGWIADPQSVKPGNKMPPYDGLTGQELRTLSTWLAGLGSE